MSNELNYEQISENRFNDWWQGSMSKRFRLYLSQKQLDENQLKFLMEHTFIEGISFGVKMQQSIINEKLNEKAQQSIDSVSKKINVE